MNIIPIDYQKNSYTASVIKLKQVFSFDECLKLGEVIDRVHKSESNPELNPKFSKYLRTEHRQSGGVIPLSHIGKIKILPQTQPIINRILEKIIYVNQNYFRFQLADVRDLKFVEYHKGEYMPWHYDITDQNEDFLTRKLNFTLFINSPPDYTGGEFMFKLNDNIEVIIPEPGLMVFYPSYILHQVEKIKSGVRRVIVGSAHGQPFR